MGCGFLDKLLWLIGFMYLFKFLGFIVERFLLKLLIFFGFCRVFCGCWSFFEFIFGLILLDFELFIDKFVVFDEIFLLRFKIMLFLVDVGLFDGCWREFWRLWIMLLGIKCLGGGLSSVCFGLLKLGKWMFNVWVFFDNLSK